MQASDYPGNDDAIMDDSLYGEVEQTQQTQQATQSTQAASQQPVDIDAHLWGFLQPSSGALKRIDFWKSMPICEIGRNPDNNQFILPGFKVSNRHCKFTWDGHIRNDSTVVVQDLSSNGTFINGEKVGKGHSRIIRDGNEIAFGTPSPQPQNGGAEDYRYVFRLLAGGKPTEGMHALYDIGTELGKGSFASVYKAMHRSTGLWYAVKMIQRDKIKKHNTNQNGNGGDPDDPKKASFLREITILQGLKHPNICQLKETFETDNNINLVLELVEGGDLLDYILSREGVAEPPAKHVTYQICEALAYIHERGIAHRDLKPENVLLTKDDPPIVKVADFGLAKVVDSLTVLRTMCGTPSYLAPEVVTQSHNEGYSHLVDSWSVGVIVFSMLTNTSPFIEDETLPDLRTRIAERQVDWVALQRAEISIDGQSFIRRLLEPRPEYRMSLANARNHPWLNGYGPIQERALTQSPSIESITPADQSYVSSIADEDTGFGHANSEAVGQGFQDMQLHPDDAPNGGIQREASRGLQRRSHVLSQAAEGDNGGQIMEPSPQMISNSQAQDEIEENRAGLKRKDHPMDMSLAPMPEEDEWSMVNDPLNNGVSGPSVPRKKGKGSADSESNPRSVRGTRANGVTEDEPAQRVRRSSRQTPQKSARKN